MNHDHIKALLTQHERMEHTPEQFHGVCWLLERRAGGLFDEVGVGKSKQIVDAAQIRFWIEKSVDTVVTVTPGYARSTWAEEDPVLGEVAAHAWEAVPNVIHEYHKRYTQLDWHPNALNWVTTNYEFIRRANRLEDLMKQLRGRKVWLVLDESWAVNGWSDQMRACLRLKNRRAEFVTLLNGTPLSDGDPEDMFYPMQFIDETVLGTNKAAFRAHYCILGTEDEFGKQRVIGHQNLDEFNAKIAPHVLSRRTRDCYFLPKMLQPLIVEAKLSDATWKLYKAMRDDAVAFLGTQASVSK